MAESLNASLLQLPKDILLLLTSQLYAKNLKNLCLLCRTGNEIFKQKIFWQSLIRNKRLIDFDDDSVDDISRPDWKRNCFIACTLGEQMYQDHNIYMVQNNLYEPLHIAKNAYYFPSKCALVIDSKTNILSIEATETPDYGVWFIEIPLQPVKLQEWSSFLVDPPPSTEYSTTLAFDLNTLEQPKNTECDMSIITLSSRGMVSQTVVENDEPVSLNFLSSEFDHAYYCDRFPTLGLAFVEIPKCLLDEILELSSHRLKYMVLGYKRLPKHSLVLSCFDDVDEGGPFVESIFMEDNIKNYPLVFEKLNISIDIPYSIVRTLCVFYHKFQFYGLRVYQKSTRFDSRCFEIIGNGYTIKMFDIDVFAY